MKHSRELRVCCFSPYPASGASVRHRVLAFRETWNQAGIALDFFPFMSERFYQIRRRFGPLYSAEKAGRFAVAAATLALRLAGIRRFDVAIIHRELFPLGGGGLDRLAARLAPATVYDLDDAIWLPPSHAVNQRRLLWRSDRTARTMAACTHVVAGNEYIARYARGFSRNVSVISTTYDDLGGPRPRDEARLPVVLWIGNWGNAEYLRQIISTLERLGREFRFVLRLVGGPDVFEVRPAGVGVEHLQWSQGREAEWLRDADIGIMPLYHREHEEGKCAFKIVQYFSAGLASVASPVGMNAALIRHGENGLLAESQEQWFESLRLLLGNAQLRRRLGTQGYLTYREQFTRDRAASAWIALLHRLAANSRGGAR